MSYSRFGMEVKLEIPAAMNITFTVTCHTNKFDRPAFRRKLQSPSLGENMEEFVGNFGTRLPNYNATRGR
jgi:hypothetical protein